MTEGSQFPGKEWIDSYILQLVWPLLVVQSIELAGIVAILPFIGNEKREFNASAVAAAVVVVVGRQRCRLTMNDTLDGRCADKTEMTAVLLWDIVVYKGRSLYFHLWR